MTLFKSRKKYKKKSKKMIFWWWAIRRKKSFHNKKDILSKKEEKKKYNLTLKANKTELFEKIKKYQNDTNKIKIDIVKYSLANDRILKARIQSAKMCSVKEIASKKVEYVQ